MFVVVEANGILKLQITFLGPQASGFLNGGHSKTSPWSQRLAHHRKCGDNHSFSAVVRACFEVLTRLSSSQKLSGLIVNRPDAKSYTGAVCFVINTSSGLAHLCSYYLPTKRRGCSQGCRHGQITSFTE
eukprot:4864953-Amphidinium_carterae.1